MLLLACGHYRHHRFDKARPMSTLRPEAPFALQDTWTHSTFSGIVGRFYAFNAQTWHRGEPGTSTNRLLLFLHYQPADAGRVPLMLDYERHRWSRKPAAYLAGPGVTPVTTVARLPIRERVLDVLGRIWVRGRPSATGSRRGS